MAFEQNKSLKSKNQFAARIMTNKGNMVCWAHVTDDTARKLFGVKSVADITYAEAAEKLPQILDTDRTHVVITDMTADLEPLDVQDF